MDNFRKSNLICGLLPRSFSGTQECCRHLQILLFCLLGVSLAAIAPAQAGSRPRSKIRFQDLGYTPPTPASSIGIACRNRPHELRTWMYLYYSDFSRQWLGPKVNERQRFFGLHQAGQLKAEVKRIETDRSNRSQRDYSKLPGQEKLFSIFHEDMKLSPNEFTFNDYDIAQQLHLFTPKFCLFNGSDATDENSEILDRLKRKHPKARWLLEISRLVSGAPANLLYQGRQIQALAQYLALFGVRGEIKSKERDGKLVGYTFQVRPDPPGKVKHWITKLAYRLSNQAAPGVLSFQTWSLDSYNFSVDYLQHPLRSEVTLPVIAAISPNVIDWFVEHELYRHYQQTYFENHFGKFSEIGEGACPKHRIKLTNRRYLWDPDTKQKVPATVRQLYATKDAFDLEQIGATLRDAIYAQGVQVLEEVSGSSWGSSDLEEFANDRREKAVELADYARSVYRHALDEYDKGHLNFRHIRKPKSRYEMLELPVSAHEVIEIFIPNKKFILSDHLEEQFYSRQVEKELLHGYAWITDYLEKLRSPTFTDWVRDNLTCYNLFHLAEQETDSDQ